MNEHRQDATDLCNTVLIRTKSSDHLQSARIDLHPPVADNADHDLLPTLLPPRPRPIPRAQMRNILHDTVHRPTKEVVFFVVHRHDYK